MQTYAWRTGWTDVSLFGSKLRNIVKHSLTSANISNRRHVVVAVLLFDSISMKFLVLNVSFQVTAEQTSILA